MKIRPNVPEYFNCPEVSKGHLPKLDSSGAQFSPTETLFLYTTQQPRTPSSSDLYNPHHLPFYGMERPPMPEKEPFGLRHFPPDILAVITSYLPINLMTTLIQSDSVLRVKLCHQGGVTAIYRVTKHPTPFFATPIQGRINATRDAETLERIVVPTSPWVYSQLTSFVWVYNSTMFSLAYLPPTLTNLDLQNTHAAEIILPFCHIPTEGTERQRIEKALASNRKHFSIGWDPFPGIVYGETTLAQLFPALRHLTVFHNQFKRTVGLIHAPVISPTVENFLLSLPPTLLSLAFSFGTYGATMDVLPLLPPHLTTLCVANQAHFGEPPSLPSFADPPPPLQRLELFDFRMHSGKTVHQMTKELEAFFALLPHLKSLSLGSLYSEWIRCLPRGLTQLGLHETMHYDDAHVQPEWPPALESFVHFLAPINKTRPLPPTINTYRINYNYPVTSDANFSITLDLLIQLGIAQGVLTPPLVKNLTCLDIRGAKLTDTTFIALPDTLRTLWIRKLDLSGHLILSTETIIPMFDTDYLISAAVRYLDSCQHKLFVCFSGGCPLFSIVQISRVPPGTEAIGNDIDLRQFTHVSAFPRSLKVLPKFISPSPQDIKQLPPQLTAMDCDTLQLPVKQAKFLPPNLTRIKRIDWILSTLMLSDFIPADLEELVLYDDIPRFLAATYLPHLTKTIFTVESGAANSIDSLPLTLKRLTVNSSQTWYKFKEKQLPLSLNELTLKGDLRLGREAFLLRFPVGLTRLTLWEEAGEHLLYGANVEVVLPNLQKLKIVHTRPLNKRIVKFAQIAPNLHTLILKGKLLLTDNMLLTSEETFPPNLTRLHLDAIHLTKESATKFPSSLTRLDLHKDSDISGEDMLKMIQSMP